MFKISRAAEKNMQNLINADLFKPVKGEAPFGRPLGVKEHTKKEYPAPKRVQLGIGAWDYDRKKKKRGEK